MVCRAEFVNVGQHHFDALRARLEALVAQQWIEPDQPPAGTMQPVDLEGELRIRLALQPVGDEQHAAREAEHLQALRQALPTADVLHIHGLWNRVVWAAAVLEKRGARSVPEAEQHTLALETTDGELIPILEDVRGRGFRTDERLREMDLELLVRKLPKSPFIQILGVYQWDGKRKLEIDYWCQVCAIAMVELKPCDCCQGETELRKRRVSETSSSKP